ncbi:PFL_4669 family integrating conjugative element protein [Shewanella colwelliana]|uniref:PFL_4669 family integrating conjugative element protein n=1 Tax=Shewanella colwelliana TaxID=23 RepID=UPI00373641D7
MENKKTVSKPNRRAKNKVGILRSHASIALHASDSVLLWHGRKDKTQGLPGFFSRTVELETAASKDDPYADHGLLLIESTMNEAFLTLNRLSTGLAKTEGRRRVTGSDCASLAPVEKPLFVSSRFGWRMVALIEEFDLFMVDLLDAQFKARVNRKAFEQQREAALHCIRSVLEKCQVTHHSGISRNDVSANNPKAISAKEKFGRIPLEVMEGVVRAEFAPEIKTRS